MGQGELLCTLVSLSLFFPLVLTCVTGTKANTSAARRCLRAQFSCICAVVLKCNLIFLLPYLVNVVTTVLFFVRESYSASGGLEAVPIAGARLVVTGVSVLFVFDVTFYLADALSITLFYGLFRMKVICNVACGVFVDLVFKILVMTTSLPVMFLVVYFGGDFLLSVLLTFFCSVFG